MPLHNMQDLRSNLVFIAVGTASIPLGNVKEFRTHMFVFSLPLPKLPTLSGVKFTNLHSYIQEAIDDFGAICSSCAHIVILSTRSEQCSIYDGKW